MVGVLCVVEVQSSVGKKLGVTLRASEALAEIKSSDPLRRQNIRCFPLLGK